VNQLLRLALCSYRPARELARPVLERALKRYVSLAPAALPPVLLALSGALSGSSSAASAGTGAEDSANGSADGSAHGGGTGAAAAGGVQAAGSRKEVALAEDGITEALLRRLLAEMRVGGEVAPAGELGKPELDYNAKGVVIILHHHEYKMRIGSKAAPTGGARHPPDKFLDIY